MAGKTTKGETPVAKSKAPSVPPIVEEVLGAGSFSVERFVECFDVLVKAAGGTAQLRQLALELAIRGKLFGETLGRQAHEQVDLDCSVSEAFPLPSNWKWSTLDEVCADSFYGPRFGKNEYVTVGGIPTIRTTDMTNEGRIELRDPPRVKIEAAKRALYLVKDGDLLVTRSGSIGTMAVFRGTSDAIPSAYLIRFRFTSEAIAEYIYVFLKSPYGQNLLGLGTTSVAQPNVNATTIRAMRLPLPPLAEQKRIVARVDELLVLIDELEAKQTRKREVGARFTQSSLEALTTAEGPEAFDAAWKRVVENWEMVIDRAEKVDDLRKAVLRVALRGRLIHSAAQTGSLPVEAPEDAAPWPIPAHWNCRAAEKLCEFITKGTTPTATAMTYGDGEVPFLKVYNLTFGGSVDFTVKPTFVTRATHANELARSKVLPGDVLMNIVGPPLGKVSIVPASWPEWNINQAIARFRVKPGLEPAFLTMCLLDIAVLMSSVAADYRGTAGQDNISLAQCRSLPIPLPPLAEQKRIVARVEQLMKLCDELEASLNLAENRASKLVEAVVQELVA